MTEPTEAEAKELVKAAGVYRFPLERLAMCWVAKQNVDQCIQVMKDYNKVYSIFHKVYYDL